MKNHAKPSNDILKLSSSGSSIRCGNFLKGNYKYLNYFFNIYSRSGRKAYVSIKNAKFKVVATVLPVITKLNVILKSSSVNTWKFRDPKNCWKRWDDSAIKANFSWCNHSPDFEDFTILGSNSNNLSVSLMEITPLWMRTSILWLWNFLIIKFHHMISCKVDMVVAHSF